MPLFACAAILLKNLSARTYTTVTNLLLWVGMCVHAGTPSSSHQGWFWAGIPIISPGVNGSSSHAVKALAGALAEKEGYGRGEFSAWINNLRAIATACCTVLYSHWCMCSRSLCVFFGRSSKKDKIRAKVYWSRTVPTQYS